jgi:hypothetical protein
VGILAPPVEGPPPGGRLDRGPAGHHG